MMEDGQAYTNVTVSMFFSGKIANAQSILHSEDVKEGNSTTGGNVISSPFIFLGLLVEL